MLQRARGSGKILQELFLSGAIAINDVGDHFQSNEGDIIRLCHPGDRSSLHFLDGGVVLGHQNVVLRGVVQRVRCGNNSSFVSQSLRKKNKSETIFNGYSIENVTSTNFGVGKAE